MSAEITPMPAPANMTDVINAVELGVIQFGYVEALCNAIEALARNGANPKLIGKLAGQASYWASTGANDLDCLREDLEDSRRARPGGAQEPTAIQDGEV